MSASTPESFAREVSDGLEQAGLPYDHGASSHTPTRAFWHWLHPVIGTQTLICELKDGVLTATLNGVKGSFATPAEVIAKLRELSVGSEKRDLPKAKADEKPPVPVSAAAAAILERAREVSRQFNHNYIGTEHLLLAVSSDANSVSGRVLAEAGVTPESVQSAITRLIGQWPEDSSIASPFTPRAKRAQFRAQQEARAHNSDVQPEHLLLGLLREDGGGALDILKMLRVAPESIRASLAPPAAA